MSVTLVLTSLPSESMLYQVLCVLDQPEVTGVILVYDGHYHVGVDLIAEKGLPFYRVIVSEEKPFFLALNEAVQLAETPYVFFFDPCLTIDSLPVGSVLKEMIAEPCLAIGYRSAQVSFGSGLADWQAAKGDTWLSFDATLVDKDRFLAVDGFDPIYQFGEAGHVGLSLHAQALGESFRTTSHVSVERLAPPFWEQGQPVQLQEQLSVAQSFLLFWREGPRVISLLGILHCLRLLSTWFFFQPSQLRGFGRAFFWLLKKA